MATPSSPSMNRLSSTQEELAEQHAIQQRMMKRLSKASESTSVAGENEFDLDVDGL